MKTTFIVTLPTGTLAERTTERVYTHAVLGIPAMGTEIDALSWCGSLKLAQAKLVTLRNAGFKDLVVAPCSVKKSGSAGHEEKQDRITDAGSVTNAAKAAATTEATMKVQPSKKISVPKTTPKSAKKEAPAELPISGREAFGLPAEESQPEPQAEESTASQTPDPGPLPDAEARAEQNEKDHVADAMDRANSELVTGAAQPAASEEKAPAAGEGGAEEKAATSRNYEYQKRVKAMTSPERFAEYAKLPVARCGVMLEESERWGSTDPELARIAGECREKVIQARMLLEQAALQAAGLPKEIVQPKPAREKAPSQAAKTPSHETWVKGVVLQIKGAKREIYETTLSAQEMDHLTFVELRGNQTSLKTPAGREIFIPKSYLSRAKQTPAA